MYTASLSTVVTTDSDLSTRDKTINPKVSLVWRFHCITVLINLCVCLRRVPGNRFVPPVRRDEGEGGGAASSCLDAVRSRVQYGGGPNSSSTGDRGGGGLPPELEGDERLKNIEPRMVELIMNEVCIYTVICSWRERVL